MDLSARLLFVLVLLVPVLITVLFRVSRLLPSTLTFIILFVGTLNTKIMCRSLLYDIRVRISFFVLAADMILFLIEKYPSLAFVATDPIVVVLLI